MALLSLFGLLVDPTDQYKSNGHKVFSNCFVWVITQIVGGVTPLSFISLPLLLLSWRFGFLEASTCSIGVRRLIIGLSIWCAAEIIFYFYCQNLKRKFEIETSFPGLAHKERQHYVQRVLDHCLDPWASLAGWFYKNDPEDIGTECVQEWLCWAFMSKNLKDLNEKERDELASLVAPVISRCPKLDRSAGNVPLNFMRLHFDRMVVQHKPFIAYAVISAMQMFGSASLSRLGFECHTLEGSYSQTYWSYCPKGKQDPTKRPVFFVHGIGIGVAMYLKPIKAILEQDPDRPIFILELPHISLKIVNYVPNMGETIESIDEIFRRHNLKTCSWVAHSYGTIVTTWVIKKRPQYINKLTFVDPVCFALWEPALIYNFLYRHPPGAIHRLCQFFVAQDLLVSYTLFRNFWWLENILFPEDLHCPTKVYLSSHDYIIDSSGVYSYLKREHEEKLRVPVPFEIIQMNGLAHGSFMNSKKYVSQIVNHL